MFGISGLEFTQGRCFDGVLLAGLELVLSWGLSAASVQSDQQESSRDPVWRRDSTCTFVVFRCFPRCLLVESEPLVDRVLLGDSSGIVVGSGDTGFVLAGSCWAIL